MSLMVQAYLVERYGPRLDVEQLAAVLDLAPQTVRNQIAQGRCQVRTYIEGNRRWAAVEDVAEYFDRARKAAS